MTFCLFSLVEQGAHTIWIDNFSKVHACKIPTIDVGAWRDCLWTGIALKKYNATVPLTMDLQTDEKERVVPAMPDDLFGTEEQLLTLLNKYKLSSEYQEECLVRIWEVDTVPMKPSASKVEQDDWRRALCGDGDKLSQMYPKEIVAVNVGSNEGLAHVMRGHYEDNKQHIPNECKTYSALNVDENIFKRTLKVKTHTAHRCNCRMHVVLHACGYDVQLLRRFQQVSSTVKYMPSTNIKY